MKSVYAIAFAAATTAASAQFGNLPACALTCLTNGLGNTDCEITDIKCVCSDQGFIADSAACIHKECGASEQKAAVAGATALCGSAGVDILATGGATSGAPEATSTPTYGSSSAVPTPHEPPALYPVPVPSKTAPVVVPSHNISANATAKPLPPQQPISAAGKLSAAFSMLGLCMLAAFVL